MPVIPLSLSSLLVPETVNAGADVLTVTGKAPEKVYQFISGQKEILQNEIDIAREIAGQKVFDTIPDSNKDLDDNRDTTYTRMSDCVEGLVKHTDPSISEPALKLWAPLQEHRYDVNKASYDTATHCLSALFVDLEKDEVKKAIKELKLTQMVADLKDAHETFESTRIRRAVMSKAASSVSMSKTVTVIRRTLKNIFNLLNALEQTDPEDVKPVIDSVNDVMTRYAILAKSRSTRRSRKNSEEESLAEDLTEI